MWLYVEDSNGDDVVNEVEIQRPIIDHVLQPVVMQ